MPYLYHIRAEGMLMSIRTIIKITEQAKLGFAACMLVLTLTGGLLQGRIAYADESGKGCAESVLDIALPELESQIALTHEYDKEKFFKTTVQSFDSGQALFSISGFELQEFDSDEVNIDNTYASGEDLGGLVADVTDYDSGSLEAGDILKAVPSITTKDEKTLGILMPPFAYFSKKF
jgi:hypothetical protein